MAADELLWSWGPGESRLAVVEQGHVVELRLRRAGDLPAGTILAARVVQVNKALGAAFVDVGLGEPGFLSEPCKEGQTVLVQVRSEGFGSKGPKLTTQINLHGLGMVYTPAKPGVAASRKLPHPERERLLAVVQPMARPEEGVVLRTRAEGMSEDALAAELDSLRARWAEIQARAKQSRPPLRLAEPDPIDEALADHPDIYRVRIDDAGQFAEAKQRHGDFVQHHRQGDVFDLGDAWDAWEEALATEVGLPGGGSIIVEPTAALTAIDVNAGGGNALTANSEAVPVIARQLRLRGIGGQAAIDFIPVRDRGHLPQLAEKLRRATKTDPVPVHVLGVTNLGLVEVTRERRGASLTERLMERNAEPAAEAVAFDALRLALRNAAPFIHCSADVAAALGRLDQARAEAGRRLGRDVEVRREAHRSRTEVEVSKA